MKKHCYCVNEVINGGGTDGGSERQLTVFSWSQRCWRLSTITSVCLSLKEENQVILFFAS